MGIRIFILTTLLLFPFFSRAESWLGSTKESPSPHYLLAQSEGDEAYDPFSDYSEFDEATEEEADIHFFRHGRFFTFGFVAGQRSFTDNLATAYQSSTTYGLYMAFFFDLRLALHFGFTTGDHGFEFSGNGAKQSGNVSLTFINLGIKYYFNTQNVSKGLAELNPYTIIALSQVYRTYTISDSLSGEIANSRDNTMGVDFGGGIEIPMMRKKAYFGVQFTYHYVQFRDSNSPIIITTSSNTQVNTGFIPKGSAYDLLGILGMNF